MKSEDSDQEEKEPPKPIDIYNRPKKKFVPPKPVDPKLLEPDEQDLYFKQPRQIEAISPVARLFPPNISALTRFNTFDQCLAYVKSQHEGCELQVGNSNGYLMDIGAGGLIAFGGDYLSLA